MKLNRVYIAMIAILVVLTYYEARIKPQSRPLYERGLALYKDRRYQLSLEELEKAYQIEPNSTAILVLRGWNFLKLRQFGPARENFSRAIRLDPTLVEPKLGLAYVALETGQGEVPVEGARALLQLDPSNRDFALAAAVAMRQGGKNVEAQKLFKGLLNDAQYSELAKQNLDDMFGVAETNEQVPEGLPPLKKPGDKRVLFRASGQYLQIRGQNNNWENFYVKGVNIGPAMPGSFAGQAPNSMRIYALWLRNIAELGANTVRVYTVLPPAFYRALKRHNETPGLSKLYLLQEIWLPAGDDENFYDQTVERESRLEVSRAIDLIHGQGDLPSRRGHAGGMYVEDVSDYVLGLLVGRELEPHLILANNAWNSLHTSFTGKYVGVPQGSPSEVWLAQIMDYAAGYELDKYNSQRPLSAVNWPPLDPLTHPTEATLAEEQAFRRKLGEKLGPLPAKVDDNDAVSLDDAKLRPQPGFEAGLFSSYHVYPFYPDFLLFEPGLLAVRDHMGGNAYFGYLQALKKHYSNMPLLIAEYGMGTSIGVSHFHPQGWNHGGLTERQQGEMLARMTANIADAGCAGGVIFEFQDEWFKTNWLTAPFDVPFDRRAMWNNILDPEENFGLWSYEPQQHRLFSEDLAAWGAVKPMYAKSTAPARPRGDGADPQRTLRSLAVSSDEMFLYLRLGVQSLPRGANGLPQLDRTNFLIGISTRPDQFGSRLLPVIFPHLRFPSGFNFLLHAGGDGARLLVASNYNPYWLAPVEGIPNRTHLEIRSNYTPKVSDWAGFQEITVETNRMRFSRDGAQFPPRRYSRSPLRFGSLDRGSTDYDSLATWAADYASNSLIFRIPWGMLFVTDPSSRQVYAGTGTEGEVQSVTTEGIGLFAVSFVPGGGLDFSRFPSAPVHAVDFFPRTDARGVFTGALTFSLKDWNTVVTGGRMKAGAAIVQRAFRELRNPS